MKPIPNRTSLAAALAVHASTLCRWLKRPDWPASKGPPWSTADVAKVRAWRRDVTAALIDDDEVADVMAVSDRGDSDAMRQAKLAVLHERARKLRIENAAAEGRLVDAAEVEAGRVQRIHMVKAAMRLAADRLAVALVGKPAADVESLVLAEMRHVASAFAGASDDGDGAEG